MKVVSCILGVVLAFVSGAIVAAPEQDGRFRKLEIIGADGQVTMRAENSEFCFLDNKGKPKIKLSVAEPHCKIVLLGADGQESVALVVQPGAFNEPSAETAGVAVYGRDRQTAAWLASTRGGRAKLEIFDEAGRSAFSTARK